MMLRSKGGSLVYNIKDENGKILKIVYPQQVFSRKQASSMRGRPDMIWQGAKKILNKYQYEFPKKEIGIYAESLIRVNGREEKIKLIDKNIDLSKVNWKWYTHNDWVIALKLIK